MGRYELLKFFMENPNNWFKIAELSKELGISERNVRRSVIRLEADEVIKGRCRGDYINWNREYTIKTD